MKHNRILTLMAEVGDGGAGGGGNGIVTTPPANGGAGTPPSWMSALPEDIRSDPTWANIKAKDANEALGIVGKMHVNAQKLLGQPKLPKPQDNWTPEQWKDFNKQLGVPDSPEGYKIPEFKFADGLKLDETKMGEWRKQFQELGILPKQADALLKRYFEDINTSHVKSVAEQEAEKTKNLGLLKSEFGDQYDAKIDIARTALRKFGDEALLDHIEKAGLANNPAFAKFLIKVGEQTLEDNAGGGGPGNMGHGPGAALQEIASLKIDKEFQTALNNAKDPGHKAAVDKWMSLHQRAYPAKQG